MHHRAPREHREEEKKVGILFRDTEVKGGGMRVLGAASPVGERVNALLPAEERLDFVIWLNRRAWERELSAHQRRALLDHELCHCYLGGQARMQGHDLEEFRCIVKRYGLWHDGLRGFGEVVAGRPTTNDEGRRTNDKGRTTNYVGPWSFIVREAIVGRWSMVVGRARSELWSCAKRTATCQKEERRWTSS